MILFKISLTCGTNICKEMYGETFKRLLMSALATVTRRSFNVTFTVKIDRVFNIAVADADIGGLKSLHTLLLLD